MINRALPGPFELFSYIKKLVTIFDLQFPWIHRTITIRSANQGFLLILQLLFCFIAGRKQFMNKGPIVIFQAHLKVRRTFSHIFSLGLARLIKTFRQSIILGLEPKAYHGANFEISYYIVDFQNKSVLNSIK